MSSPSGQRAGPSPAVHTGEDDRDKRRTEQDLVSDALCQLPSLNAHSRSPLTTPARGSREAATSTGVNASLSLADTSYTLGADEEELLLQELLNITAGTAPFVSSKSASAAADEFIASPGVTSSSAGHGDALLSTQAPPPSMPEGHANRVGLAVNEVNSAKSPPTELRRDKKTANSVTPQDPAQFSKSSPAQSRVAARAVAKAARALSSKEEQEILDAILAAVDGQQSSVSGDLTGPTSGPNAAPSDQAAVENQQLEEEQDAVERVLEEAKLLASSTVLCETQRGELVLHIHEHIGLRRSLAGLSKTIGAPTCVALAEAPSPQVNEGSSSSLPAPTNSSKLRSLAVAVGTSLGAVALFDQRWSLLGLCGSAEADVVSARGATVSLSLSSTVSAKEANEEPTAATGHAKGVFILWSLHSFSPLRIIKDECTVPLLRVQHLHRDSTRVLILESSGAVKLFQFWKVLSKHMLRSTTITPASTATPVSDMDTLPYPSAFYLRHLSIIKENMPNTASVWDKNDGIPWLIAPPPLLSATAASAGVPRTNWSAVADKHLVAAVTTDAVLIYVVEVGLQGAVSCIARHTHPPSSALSNEVICFVPVEQDGVAPRVLLCVSWNTEIEVLLLNLRLPDEGSSVTGAKAGASDPLAQGVERIALLRLTAPLLQMVPLAGCNVLLLDQNNNAQLMDASVAVLVERHHFAALEYVTFVSRLCGMKFNGTVASNQSTALLLGKEHSYGISIYSWRERLSTLVARRKFVEALDLAKCFAEEVALSTVGLSRNAAQRRRELHQYMERVLLAYLESSLSNGTQPCSPPARAAEPLVDVLQYIASYCSAADALDLLYGSITRTLRQQGLLAHLLCVLERTMRRGIVTYMPEPLIERFIDLFLHEKELAAVEAALGVHPPQQAQALSSTASYAYPAAAIGEGLSSRESELSTKDRAELALMCLDTDLPNLLRIAQRHKLLRLTVTIMSYHHHQYAEALAYALDEEEAEGEQKDVGAVETASGATTASVAVDLVEYTLKDCTLLPGTDIPSNEQRPAKKALLEFLLQTSAQGQHNLLRFLRREPQHAVRVLLFALSDEGLCSPWSSSTDGLCRTQFVSSVFFILTGGTRMRPRLSAAGSEEVRYGRQGGAPVNLFLVDDDELSRAPILRKLCATELAQRRFPPYEAVHTFLTGAALFGELFLADGEEDTGGFGGNGAADGTSTVRFDVWIDLVIQDGLYMFQNAETAEERRALQEQLISIMAPAFIPRARVALFHPDFTRLRMARCLAALLCKEQRYTEAILCYTDPEQNVIDPSLQHDVFAMLRGEMQRLQDLKTHATNAALQLSASWRFESDVFGDAESGDNVSASPLSADTMYGSRGGPSFRGPEKLQQTSNTSFASPLSAASPPQHSYAAKADPSAIDEAIKALQRGVMSQVETLVRIDATALAQFIFDYLPSNHREVMRLLGGSSAAFLDYLDELIAQDDPTVASDIHLQNTYIELLCAHAPDRVFAHLREKGASITYDVHLALRAVRKYRIADASIFLLEKAMMIEEAVTVMVDAARATLADVREEVIAQVAAGTESHDGSAAIPYTIPKKGSSRNAFTSASTAVEASAAEKIKSTAHAESPGAVSDFLVGATAVAAAPQLLHLIDIGKSLCQKYQAGRRSGNSGGGGVAGGAGGPLSQSPEYWFRLLDVFMVPRRLLCQVTTQDEQLLAEGIDGGGASGSTEGSHGHDATVMGDGTGVESELEVAARCAAVSTQSNNLQRSRGARHYTSSSLPDGTECRLPQLTQPLTPCQRNVIAALMSVYTQCTSDVLRAMMSSLDLSVVMDKVVQDNKEEAFRPFKPIILDMMASLSFDIEASRLCASVTESDVMSLGRELYQKLNTGIVTLSDCCALCHLHLSEPPPASIVEAAPESSAGAVASSPSSSAVCVYMCGHTYHTLCCRYFMGPSQQQQQQGEGCYVCANQHLLSGPSGKGFACSRRGMGGTVGSTTASAGPAAASSSNVRQATTVNVARMQRRIRQTKVKVDHTEDLYPVLKSYLAWGDSAPSTPANGYSGAADADSWVLSPSPRVPAAIGELATSSQGTVGVAVNSAEEKGLDVETLTDAEILELFGTL